MFASLILLFRQNCQLMNVEKKMTELKFLLYNSQWDVWLGLRPSLTYETSSKQFMWGDLRRPGIVQGHAPSRDPLPPPLHLHDQALCQEQRPGLTTSCPSLGQWVKTFNLNLKRALDLVRKTQTDHRLGTPNPTHHGPLIEPTSTSFPQNTSSHHKWNKKC